MASSGNVLVKRFMVNVGKMGGSFKENSYIVYEKGAGEAVIIDPGAVDSKIEEFLKVNALSVVGILNTHGHYDHIGGNIYYANLFKAGIQAHHSDKSIYPEGMRSRITFFKGNSLIKLSGFEFKVFHTPGHTEGSVSYLIGDHLFSGDTLFKGSIGRTWGKTQKERMAKAKKIVMNLKNKLFSLPNETKVLPGHGLSTTIGKEKLENPFFR